MIISCSTPRPAGLRTPGTASMLNVGCELLAERSGVLGAQVDLISRAIESKRHGLVRLATGQIVFQRERYLLGHRYLPLLRWWLHRTQGSASQPAATPQAHD